MLVGISLQTPGMQNTDKPDVTLSSKLERVAQLRCKASYEGIFMLFAPKIKAYAVKKGHNPSQAMDIVQETMTNVWLKAHLFDASKGTPSTWIYTIARNVRFDLLRKQQQRQGEISAEDLWPVLSDIAVAEQSFEDKLTVAQIKSMLSRLPDAQRLVIEGIYLDGKSQQEVADILNLPLGTVKSRTRLALQKLKDLVDKK